MPCSRIEPLYAPGDVNASGLFASKIVSLWYTQLRDSGIFRYVCIGVRQIIRSSVHWVSGELKRATEWIV
jgi:hypothetical protein